jgi:hypothetical protein
MLSNQHLQTNSQVCKDFCLRIKLTTASVSFQLKVKSTLITRLEENWNKEGLQKLGINNIMWNCPALFLSKITHLCYVCGCWDSGGCSTHKATQGEANGSVGWRKAIRARKRDTYWMEVEFNTQMAMGVQKP